MLNYLVIYIYISFRLFAFKKSLRMLLSRSHPDVDGSKRMRTTRAAILNGEFDDDQWLFLAGQNNGRPVDVPPTQDKIGAADVAGMSAILSLQRAYLIPVLFNSIPAFSIVLAYRPYCHSVSLLA